VICVVRAKGVPAGHCQLLSDLRGTLRVRINRPRQVLLLALQRCPRAPPAPARPVHAPQPGRPPSGARPAAPDPGAAMQLCADLLDLTRCGPAPVTHLALRWEWPVLMRLEMKNTPARRWQTSLEQAAGALVVASHPARRWLRARRGPSCSDPLVSESEELLFLTGFFRHGHICWHLYVINGVG